MAIEELEQAQNAMYCLFLQHSIWIEQPAGKSQSHPKHTENRTALVEQNECWRL
jgi:hypothetical protein